MKNYKIGILTISDRCSRGEAVDSSGPALCQLVREFGMDVTLTAISPDESANIQAILKEWAVECALILTTGGTGLSPRDITPEATAPLLDRLAPGIAELIRWSGYQTNPRAALSRGLCGLRGKCLIVNLPGSVKGATEGWDALKNLLPHALDIANDGPIDH